MTLLAWLSSLVRWSRRVLSGAARSPKKKLNFTAVSISSASADEDGNVRLCNGSATLIFKPNSGQSQFFVGRLVFTEALRLEHEKQMRETAREQLLKYQSPELRNMILPVLKEWLSGRGKLDVLELGPAYTTAIPEGLIDKLGSYHAIDFSLPYLQRQQEILQENAALAPRCQRTVVDIYDLEKPEASFDLVFTSCHPPLVSSSIEDKCAVLDKVHALLRPGGTFALFPWYFSEQPQAVNRHLLKLFHVKRIAYQHDWRVRLFIILEKR